MRLLSTLYITDHRARVAADHHALMVIGGDGGRSRVPLEALDSVILASHAQVTSDALAACAKRQIRVTSVQANGKIRFAVGGGISGNVLLRLAQYRAADERSCADDVARVIVAGKLQNARRLLQRWAWDVGTGRAKRLFNRLDGAMARRIEGLPNASSADAIRGFEGEGTRIYFFGMRKHLQAIGCAYSFEVRSRRPPRDPVNATLSFAYGLLLAEISGALESVGLDPQVGFLHGVRPGRPSLALDLMEEMRPSIADRFVVGMFSRRMFGDSDFVRTTGGACYLTPEGRDKFIREWEGSRSQDVMHPLLKRLVPRAGLPLVQAILMARHLRGDLPAYPPFIMSG